MNVGGHIGKNQHWKTQEKRDCLNSHVQEGIPGPRVEFKLKDLI